MKRTIVIFLCLFTFQVTRAQKTELKFSMGYDFSSASQYFISEIEDSNNSYNYKKVDASLGRGLVASAGIHRLLKPWLGISIDADYRKSLPAVKGTTKVNTFTDYSYSEDNKWSSQIIEVSPSVILKIPGQKINPYSKFGFVVPVYSKIKVEGRYTASSFSWSSSGENTKIYRLKNTIGYNAAIGIAPAINKKVSFIAEIRLSSQSIQVKKSTLTSDIVNGSEMIGTYTVSMKETIYVKKLDNQQYNADEPTRELGFSLPYSSIGLHAGLSIKL